MAEYPTEKELKTIEKWSLDDWEGLLAFIEPLWIHYGRFTRKPRSLEMATGGWSGNESIMEALRKNMFFMIAWESSHRGGLFKFNLSSLRRLKKSDTLNKDK